MTGSVRAAGLAGKSLMTLHPAISAEAFRVACQNVALLAVCLVAVACSRDLPRSPVQSIGNKSRGAVILEEGPFICPQQK